MKQFLDVTPQITIHVWLKVIGKLLSLCVRESSN